MNLYQIYTLNLFATRRNYGTAALSFYGQVLFEEKKRARRTAVEFDALIKKQIKYGSMMT